MTLAETAKYCGLSSRRFVSAAMVLSSIKIWVTQCEFLGGIARPRDCS